MKITTLFKKEWDKILLGTIIIFAFILRLVNLNQSFWLDEAAQVIESARSFPEQFSLASDFHPPLYHLVLHFWMKLGHGEIWIRLLSVLFGMGTIIIAYKICETFGKKKEGILTAFLSAISPYHIWYSQEARPYMLFVLLSLVSTYLLIRGRWKLYTIFITLSLFTLYFAPFLILGHIFYMLFIKRKELFSLIKSLLTAGILFIFWLPSFINQLKIGTGGIFSGWSDIVSFSPLRSIPLTFAKFIFGHGSLDNKIIYGIIVLSIIIIFICCLIKIIKTKEGKVLFIFFFIPLIAAFMASFFIKILAPQRLLFLLPLFYIILSLGIIRFPQKIKIIALFIIFIVSMGGVYQYYTDPSVQREQWRQAVQYVENEASAASVSLFVFPDPFAPYLWYKQGKIETWGISPNFIIRDKDLIKLSSRLKDKKRIYLFQYLTGLTDPENKTGRLISSIGFKETDIKNFPGVGFVYIYDK